jgi:hypothetical protein
MQLLQAIVHFQTLAQTAAPSALYLACRLRIRCDPMQHILTQILKTAQRTQKKTKMGKAAHNTQHLQAAVDF